LSFFLKEKHNKFYNGELILIEGNNNSTIDSKNFFCQRNNIIYFTHIIREMRLNEIK